MKITKFVHSCLLVEMPEPVNRTVLFDPGVFSEDALDIDSLQYLDDIFITHEHPDHFNIDLIKKLVEKFPQVRITTTSSIVLKLQEIGIESSALILDGVTFFNAPHEGHEPFMNPPEEVGIHYLDMLSHPGDSHSFTETKNILALPITAPWGSADRAMQLAIELKPKHVIPVHDWHWKDEVREQIYEKFESLLKTRGITFHKMKTGEPVVIEA
jgi:L-ascorbate metabolism protein UlaG (beta-lactamase superfamily)